MKRRGPKNKLQRGIRELLIGCVIGCAVGISFDLILFAWLILEDIARDTTADGRS